MISDLDEREVMKDKEMHYGAAVVDKHSSELWIGALWTMIAFLDLCTSR